MLKLKSGAIFYILKEKFILFLIGLELSDNLDFAVSRKLQAKKQELFALMKYIFPRSSLGRKCSKFGERRTNIFRTAVYLNDRK